MATNPAFASTPLLGLAVISGTASTSLTSPTVTTPTLFTAGTGGSRIEVIRLMQTAGTGAAGILNIFVARSSVNYLIDTYSYGNTGAFTVSVQSNPVDIYYSFFDLNSGDTVFVNNTNGSGTGGTWIAAAFGGSF